MRGVLALVYLSIVVFISCNSATNKGVVDFDNGGDNYAEVIGQDQNGYFYGSMFNIEQEVPFTQMIRQLHTQDTVYVTVSGYVESVCQAKGCWANFVEDKDRSSASLFVKFKDYSFFLPLNAAGKAITLTGKAFKEVTTIQDLKHYAEDAGKTQEEINSITVPKEELKFIASGAYMPK